jgi:hypothetical protein
LDGEAQALQEAVRIAEAATQTAIDRLERVLREQDVVAVRRPLWRRWLAVTLGLRRRIAHPR